MFRKYHYLNTDLHQAASQYIGMIGNELVCHTGIIQMPMKKGSKRVHRLVVLPDYQGIGIGTRFIKAVAEDITRQGLELNLTTTTPSIVHALSKSKDWILARYGYIQKDFKTFEEKYGINYKHLNNAISSKRVTYSFWFNAKNSQKKGA